MKITKKSVLALASFVLLMLQAFGIKFDVPVVNELLSSAASVLVMLGIITDTGDGKGDKTENGADGKTGSKTDTRLPDERTETKEDKVRECAESMTREGKTESDQDGNESHDGGDEN